MIESGSFSDLEELADALFYGPFEFSLKLTHPELTQEKVNCVLDRLRSEKFHENFKSYRQNEAAEAEIVKAKEYCESGRIWIGLAIFFIVLIVLILVLIGIFVCVKKLCC